ncbi:hypothetical protein M409DRAFT_26428 [Zasmidium cellare ATCC 36951]|uniref:Uncharacterized protein n=1 Tax=Zasmidium cellare ATCC 36951 TaxID=1080233 RepID=A0A6A6CBU8_ZASCE|nr:uncharacterized protein M409DRAFT_26428 [Zasmidium cellare ATCC 36951]KAF2163392.1 hypothetical protein M409DRAFT_26428 [Zasmidium cellare ATCC 36951]
MDPNNGSRHLPMTGQNLYSTPPPEPLNPTAPPAPPDQTPFLAVEYRQVTDLTVRTILDTISHERSQTLTSLSLPILLYSTNQTDSIPRVWLTEVPNSSNENILHVPVATISSSDENADTRDLTEWLSMALAETTPAKSVVDPYTYLCGAEDGRRLVVLVRVVTEDAQGVLEEEMREGYCDGVWMAREDLERKEVNYLGDYDFVNEFLEEDLRREVFRGFDELGVVDE